MPLVHHELCFGCGRTNLFGILLEAERTAPDAVEGRCFIKQDHQGSVRGRAHEGVVTAALVEIMALACGDGEALHATSLEVALPGEAAVGTFLHLSARAHPAPAGELQATASAWDDPSKALVAEARARFAAR